MSHEPVTRAMVVTVGAGRVDDRTDAEVIEASWHTPDEFGALHDRHVGALYRYACQRVGPAAAEDGVADTFLAAFSQRGRFDLARVTARPWLFGILTHRIARWSRAERTHYQAYARAAQAPVAEALAERVAEQASAQALRGQLAQALCRLRRGDRDVLLLIAWGQLSYDEVADALGIPVGTVASRLNRARRKVREALSDAAGL
ncbi:MAG TPA: RNA polymerase sigma factor [Micromonosporaceae bacterium]|nr:RNA polymerase sigma factor [Micromonosporaceae bacterium]